MEEKRLSHSFIIISIFFIIIACESITNKYVKLGSTKDNILILKKTYRLQDSSQIIGANRIISIDNKEFYFSNMFSRCIYQTVRPFVNIKKIGNNGKGPCEYDIPYYIQLFNNNIYFSDNNSTSIERYPLSGIMHEDSCTSFNSIHGGLKFALNDDYVCILNVDSSFVYIYNVKTRDVYSPLPKFTREFRFINEHISGGGLFIDKDNILYVTSVVPIKVWKVNLQKEIPFVENEWNFKNVISMDSTQIKNIFKNNKSKRENMMKFSSIPFTFNMFLLGEKEQNIIISQINGNKSLYKYAYYIINKSGKTLNIRVSDTQELVGAVKNRLFFVDYIKKDGEKYFILKEYEYKEKITKNSK